MSTLRRLITTGAVTALAAAGLVATAAPALAANTTYYVDAATGSDTAAGTSPTTAWKTLAKVNATTFGAGDRILFQGGQTWAGQLKPLGSGASGNPITLGAYGTGRPKIDGGSLPSGGAIQLTNQSYWTVTGFEVVSNSGTDNFGSLSVNGTSRNGILIRDDNQSTVTGVSVTNNYVHDVNGCFRCGDIDGHANGGIMFSVPGITVLGLGGGSFVNSTISGNTVDHVGRTGIGFVDYATGNFFSADPASLSTNTTITGNTVTNTDSDGILLWGSKTNLMEHNVVGNAGLRTIAGDTSEPATAGLWPTHSLDTVIQYNEVYGTRTQEKVDGQGFDVDGLATNTTVQYNYSHDNQGGFLLTEGADAQNSSNATVRYNLSVNDSIGTGDPAAAKGVITFALGIVTNTNIYNNTIYVPAGSPARIFYCDQCGTNAITKPWSLKNNVIVNLGSGGWALPPGTSGVIDHNLIFGNHPAGEPADAAKITADPLLVAPGATAPSGIGSVAGYKLGAGSPAIGSGAVITGNGGKDYFGTSVPASTAPNRGFAQ